MKIEHIAIWTKDIERSRNFHKTFFNAKSGDKYKNSEKGFSSYFLNFDNGCRLEIMNKKNDIKNIVGERFFGISHFAMSVGTKQIVDELTETLRKDGFNVVSSPRETGDGYYESVVLDPDGNRIELTI